MLEDLAAKDIRRVEDVNTGLGGNKEVLKKKYHHLIILVKNQVGLKNLYKIVSAAHTEYFFKRPRVPRSLLNQYREGLLLGSACEAGELYRAIVAGRDMDELKRIAAYYDFLEIQPLGNNEFMLRNGTVNSLEQIKDFNRKVVRVGRGSAPAGGRHRRRPLPWSRKMPSTAASSRRAAALRTRTTRPPCTSAPPMICWHSLITLARRWPTKSSSTNPNRHGGPH